MWRSSGTHLLALLGVLLAVPVSAQTRADTVSAMLHGLSRIGTRDAAIPVGAAGVCLGSYGGHFWPDSIRGGVSFGPPPASTSLLEEARDSLAARLSTDVTLECVRPDAQAQWARSDSLGRPLVSVSITTPVFITPDSAAIGLGYSRFTHTSHGWGCWLRRVGDHAWSHPRPCLESVARRH